MWLADPMKSDEHVMLCGYNNHDSPGTMGALSVDFLESDVAHPTANIGLLGH